MGRPLILVSPDVEEKGREFGDFSISLSGHYQQALDHAGGIPLAMPATTSPEVVSEAVAACDGLMLTGGDDVDARLYEKRLAPEIARLVKVTPDHGGRDYREVLLIEAALRWNKPLLAICRGHQMLNVALGGTLLADIGAQAPGKLHHRQMEKRCEIVHDVRLTPDSLLAKIVGGRKLGVNSTHHQAVARIAPPLRAVALSPDGMVEGLELKPAIARGAPFLLSVQFHPERLVDRYPKHQAIFDAFVKACRQ